MISIVTGFVAGFLHVLAGPDHLAAVAPLSADNTERSWTTGLRWGLGHASGVILVAVLCLIFRDLLPLESLSAWAEQFVGVALVLVGIWGIRRAVTVHTHIHGHGEQVHTHMHAHWKQEGIAGGVPKHRHSHAALAIGTLHGLAGSSHLFGVLPALAFPTALGAATYLAAFGIGSVLAMIVFSGVLGLVVRNCQAQRPGMYRTCMLTCSAAAIVVGGWWLVAGFTAHAA